MHTKNLNLVGVHSDEVYDLRIFFKLEKIFSFKKVSKFAIDSAILNVNLHKYSCML